MSMINYEIYESFDEVKDLWIDFQKDANLYAFQTYEWLSFWYNNIGIKQNVKPLIIVARPNESKNQISFILPLSIRKKSLIKILTWMGEEVTDYQGAIISKEFDQSNFDESQFIDYIASRISGIDLICFEKQPEFINNVRNPFLFRESEHYENAYSLIPDQNWEIFYNERIKSKIRNDTLRQERRLKELGDVRFYVAKSIDDIENITSVMIKHKTRRYRETGRRDLFRKHYFSNFYHTIAVAYPESINQELLQINVSALFLNNEPIATHWGISFKDRFYYLMPTYEGGELAKYSAGRILLTELLDYHFGKAIKIFDFTIGSEEYKKDWCNSEIKLYRSIIPITAKGYFYSNYLKLFNKLRKTERLMHIAKVIRLFVYRILINQRVIRGAK